MRDPRLPSSLDLPQYPKALGSTVAELQPLLSPEAVFSKQKFSMWTPEVAAHVAAVRPGFTDAILCGIEAHVCVQQTALELLAQGKRCWVVVDGVSSQRAGDRAVALQLMRDAGAFLTTTESLIFGLLGGADAPDFKPVQRLLMDTYLKQGASALL